MRAIPNRYLLFILHLRYYADTMKDAVSIYFRYLELERNMSPNTMAAYRSDLAQFFAFFEESTSLHASEALPEIQRDHIREWMGELMNSGVSKRSIARKLAALRSFFKFNVRRGHLSKNPAAHILTPRLEKRLPALVSEPDLHRILDAHVSDESTQLMEQTVLELFYSSGIRVSELVTLCIADVNFQGQLITVLGKGAKQRIVPIGQKAASLLRVWIEGGRDVRMQQLSPAQKHSFVFLTPRGLPAYRNQIYRIVRNQLLHTEGGKNPHALRHSYATHLLDHGADIRVVKELLGHSSLAATQVYAHTSLEHLKKSYQTAHPRALRNTAKGDLP